jgi:hypothetical protein
MKKLLIVAILTMMANQAQALTVNELSGTSDSFQDGYMMGLIDGGRSMGLMCGGETYAQNIAELRRHIVNSPAAGDFQIGTLYLESMVIGFKCDGEALRSSFPELYHRSEVVK